MEGVRKQHMFMEKKNKHKTKTGKKNTSLAHRWNKIKGLASGTRTYAVCKKPPNQGKAPETGQLLIEYNINYRVHH